MNTFFLGSKKKTKPCRALFEPFVESRFRIENMEKRYQFTMKRICNCLALPKCSQQLQFFFHSYGNNTICLCEFRITLCKCVNSKRLFRALFNAFFYICIFSTHFFFFVCMPTLDLKSEHTHISVVDSIQY